jgi:hypothetical protein
MTKLTATFRKFANAPKRNVVTWAVLYAVNEESRNSLRYRIRQLGFYLQNIPTDAVLIRRFRKTAKNDY